VRAPFSGARSIDCHSSKVGRLFTILKIRPYKESRVWAEFVVSAEGGRYPSLRARLPATETFVIAQEGLHPVDYLAGGSTLTISIGEDSTVTGHLFIPATLTGDEPFEADMAGRAVVTPGRVTFDQTADTFIRDLIFLRHPGSIEAYMALNPGTSYHLRLLRIER